MTVTASTDQIPDRLPNQDEAVALLVFRRTDPDNPTGSGNPDIPDLDQISAGVSFAAIAEQLGFDPEQSYVTMARVTDVEQGGAITLSALAALGQNPPPEG